MGTPSAHEVTGLLQAWSAGDEEALQKLMPLVYQELHRLARRYMADERSSHTLQTTALINEAYLRLVDVRRISWQNPSYSNKAKPGTLRIRHRCIQRQPHSHGRFC
jgi:hypothetical protein